MTLHTFTAPAWEIWREMQPALVELNIITIPVEGGTKFYGARDDLDNLISKFYDGSGLNIQLEKA